MLGCIPAHATWMPKPPSLFYFKAGSGLPVDLVGPRVRSLHPVQESWAAAEALEEAPRSGRANGRSRSEVFGWSHSQNMWMIFFNQKAGAEISQEKTGVRDIESVFVPYTFQKAMLGSQAVGAGFLKRQFHLIQTKQPDLVGALPLPNF